MKWLMAILLGAILVPIAAYAGHDPQDIGHIDYMTEKGIHKNFCGSSATWIQDGSLPTPTGSGNKRVGATMHYVEGYHDLDLRLTRPDGTTHFYSEQGTGVINEEVYDTTYVTGTYTVYTKCFNFNSIKDTGTHAEYSVAGAYWRL